MHSHWCLVGHESKRSKSGCSNGTGLKSAALQKNVKEHLCLSRKKCIWVFLAHKRKRISWEQLDTNASILHLSQGRIRKVPESCMYPKSNFIPDYAAPTWRKETVHDAKVEKKLEVSNDSEVLPNVLWSMLIVSVTETTNPGEPFSSTPETTNTYWKSSIPLYKK